MKHVLLVLVILLCLPHPGGGAVPAGLRGAIVVVALLNPDARRYHAIGTGFHAGGGQFYTNAHVILGGQKFQREEPGFKQWILIGGDEFGNPQVLLGNAEIRCVDRRYQPDPYGDPQPYDVAAVRLVEARRPAPPPVVTSQSRVAVGHRVRVIGYPDGAVLFEMRGTVTEVATERIVVMREPGTVVLPGSSGSPLFNANDEAVGILQAGSVGRLVSQFVPIQSALTGCPITRE